MNEAEIAILSETRKILFDVVTRYQNEGVISGKSFKNLKSINKSIRQRIINTEQKRSVNND